MKCGDDLRGKWRVKLAGDRFFSDEIRSLISKLDFLNNLFFSCGKFYLQDIFIVSFYGLVNMKAHTQWERKTYREKIDSSITATIYNVVCA